MGTVVQAEAAVVQYTRIAQPHLDCRMTYFIMHVLAMETRRRRKATAGAHSDKLLAA